MKIFIIQEEFSGIPDTPELFTNEQKANARYVMLVNNNCEVERECQNIDEAMNVITEDNMSVPEKWYVRYWELEVSIENK